ncbi:hypothetical protein FDP41_002428 [Naegleria fowleri]|uniref:Major facilitator superfamily (MFS) profile domain-containing protein n=1 Tax=Naegleria fowleri TaxID=5763 RepID=A0A6A5BY11_NAEFO|nr:uncharacterized protein FDP41_002428 [Naegleria fowleri]KAF0978608.1 hypothetical protein FDP41_002428 [Naegleria fowleri]CAG4710441.1 unnamed protein product [Naegleria fowleri]
MSSRNDSFDNEEDERELISSSAQKEPHLLHETTTTRDHESVQSSNHHHDYDEEQSSPPPPPRPSSTTTPQEEEEQKPPPTPLPKLSILMISLLIIAEAVGFSILYPVVPFMVRDFLLLEAQQQQQIHTNSTSIGLYSSISSIRLGNIRYHSSSSFHHYPHYLFLPKSSLFFISENSINFASLKSLLNESSSSSSSHHLSNNFVGNIPTFIPYYEILNHNITMNNYTNQTNHEISISEERVGLLVGILASAFSLAQLISNWFISRASDHVGRKPLLMFGLITNIVFLSLFSISRNFWYALVVRIVHGLLNANIPIYKSFLVDITDDSNQQKAFVIVSILWAISNVVSPGIGGWLSRPSDKWSSLLGGEASWFHKFFTHYPYVLALMVPILMNIITLVLNVVFMKETLVKKSKFAQKLDDFYNAVLVKLRIRKSQKKYQTEDEENMSNSVDGDTSMDMDEIDNSRDNILNVGASDPTLESSTDNLSKEDSLKKQSVETVEEVSGDENSMLLLLKDKTVVKVVFLYMFLAIATSMMDEMMPVYMSNSVQKRGLAFDSSDIGIILSIGGFTSLIMLVIYPKMANIVGFLWMFRIGLAIYAVIATGLTFSSELVRFEFSGWFVWIFVTVCVFIKACAQEVAYTAQFMLVNNAAPSPRHIGSINGLAHIVASLGWSSGPMFAGLLFKWGLDWADQIYAANPTSFFGQVPLVDKLSFFVCGLVCLINFALSLTVPKWIVLGRRYEKGSK